MKMIFRSVSLTVCLSMILSLSPQPSHIGWAGNAPGEKDSHPVHISVGRTNRTFSHLASPPPASRIVTGTIPTFPVAPPLPQMTANPSPMLPVVLRLSLPVSDDRDNALYLPIMMNSRGAQVSLTSPTDSIAWIENFWVDSTNSMRVIINTSVPTNNYKLYVRKYNETFGDDPHYQYYQIYAGVFPKDLLVILNLEPNTVYCAEIRSDDSSTRHDITSYKTGSSGPPYYGGICLDSYCPADYTNNVCMTDDLVINPSTPIEGETVHATFSRVCNDGWNDVSLGQTYVRVNTGEHWASRDYGTLSSCNCNTVNYDRTRTFTPGSKTAMAGYDSGGWHTFGTRSSVDNQQTFNVLTAADVRLETGTSLSLSSRKVSPGESVTAQFTAHNYGQDSATERFRVAIYDGTGANYITTFLSTTAQTLSGGGEYAYSESYTFNTAGVYWIKAQHCDNAQDCSDNANWIDLAGNGRLSLRVQVPPPPPDPKVKGYAPPCPHAGEPVNTATGNFTSEHTDLSRPGPGLSFTFKRFYNGIDAATSQGPLGYGWTHSFQHGFDWRVDDTVVITHTDGHIAYFIGDLGIWPDVDPGTYTADNGVLDTLFRDTQGTPGVWNDDTFVLTTTDQVHYYFDTNLRLARIEDRSGNTQHLAYDGSGRLIHIVDTANVTYTFAYSGSLITNVTSSNGESIAYGYDEASDLVSFTNAAGDAMTYTYDENHRMLTGTDTSGRLFVENVYDEQGRVIEQQDAEGRVSLFNYDALTQTTIYTDVLGNPLIQTYDERHRLVKGIDALGHFITNTYDLNDNVVAARDKNGNVTRYTYDERGNLLTRTDALGHVWIYTYDPQNNLLTETDPLSNTITYEYDTEGRLIRKTDPEGASWEYSYNGQGLTVWARDPGGAETQYGYNDLGLPVTVTNALSQTTLLGYNALGRKLSYTDAAGSAVRYAYDEMGRTTVITAPDGGVTTFGYDPMGNLVAETNALGHTRVFTYDVYNRLVAETDWAGHVTRHEYDALGRPVRDVDPLGYTTVYTYDAVGRLAAQQDKNDHVTTYTHDSNGNRLTETDPLGRVTTTVYDALNRVVEVINPASCCATTHRYTDYDAAGRVVRETDALGHVTTFEYDRAGRLITRTNALSETTVYAYDAAGRLTVETDALGQQTRHAYDLLGQLITTTNRLGYFTVQRYDAVGRVVETLDENGHATRQVYDRADRVVAETDPLSHTTTYTYDLLGNKLSETDVLGYTRTYTYDPNGNLLTETDANGHTTRYVYDALGRMTQKTDPLGGITRYTYDPNGNLVTETDPLSHTTTYEYDALGRQVRVVDAEGYTTAYEYDEAGNLATRTDVEGHTWRYEYDANGNLIAETDPLGRVTRYEYDALDRQVRATDALGSVSLTSYDMLGRVAEMVNAAGQRPGYTYDAEGRLIVMSDALGFYSTYAYDPAGNQVQMADRLGYTTTYAYDALNRQTALTDALGGVSTWGYDALGRVVTTTDELGRPTIRAYDPAGNLLAETNALGGATVYGYDALNRQVAVTDANGHTTLTHYDAAGQVLTTTLPGGGEITYTYDQVGSRLSETDPAGRTRRWEYDGLGRAVRELDPLGHATESEYDGVGNLVLERDALGRETRFAYDVLNRLVEVADAAGYVTRYVYDPVGNLIRQQDANGHLTRFEYDARNQRIRETDPLGRSWLYQYDAEGQQTGLRKPDGAVILYEYDPLGRLALTDYPDATPNVSFTYDAAGNRLSMADGTGVTTYSYDVLDRLTRITYPGGEQVGYDYDGVGNRVRVDYPLSGQVMYAFDADDRLQSVTTSEGVIAYTRDPAGQPLRVDYPNGAYVAHIYDGAGRVTGVSNGNADGEFATYTFTLNGVGNKTQEVETLAEEGDVVVITTTYAYDARDELVRSIASDGVQAHYIFDAAGNRTRMSGVRQRESWREPYAVSYTYNAANQLLAATDSALGQTVYRYDVNGNRVALAAPERRVSYAYDAEERLTRTEVTVLEGESWVYLDGQVETYAYDGQSRRVRKAALDADDGTALTQQEYVYGDDWNVLQETVFPITMRRYVYDDAMQRLQVWAGGAPGYFHTDGLGSAVGYTEADGTLRSADGLRRYGDYGDVLAGGASWWTDTAYTGHEREAYTGLYYARHRYYDPEVGVWLTLDTAQTDSRSPLTLHRYAYTRNNPINYIDRLGLREVRLNPGGLELWKYCNRYHPGSQCELRRSNMSILVRTLWDVVRPVPWAWRCERKTLGLTWWAERVDYDRACRLQYGSGAYHKVESSNNPYSIWCYKNVGMGIWGVTIKLLIQQAAARVAQQAKSAVETIGTEQTEGCGKEREQSDSSVDSGTGDTDGDSGPNKGFTTISQIAREAYRQWKADNSRLPVVNGVTIPSACNDCFRFVGSVYKALGRSVDPNRFGTYLDTIPNNDSRVVWASDRDTSPIEWSQLRGGDIHYWLNVSENVGHALILLDNKTEVAHTSCSDANGLTIQPANLYDPDYYEPGKPRVRIVRLP